MSTIASGPWMRRITQPSNRMGLVGAGLLVLTGVFAVYRAVPIVKAIGAGGTTTQATDGSEAILKYAAALKNDTSQINGRSFFFDPPPPPPPHVDPPPELPKPDPGPPPPPPKPTSYGGPKVVGTAFDTVWFDNNKTMRVGGTLENEMRIISISTAPYVVRIEWKEVEFDVPFLPRDSVIDKSRPAPPAPPEPAPAAPTATPTTTPPANPTATPTTPPAAPSPTPSTTPAVPGEKKDEKKDEKKEEKKDDPKPAEKPAGETPPSPPDKKSGSP